MAKAKCLLESELEDADLMTILSNGGSSNIFKKNDMIDYSYPTGISLIDYAFGYEINIKDDTGTIIDKRLCTGLQAGTFNVIAGATQTFKSTIGIQICSNIAYKYNGNIYHYDAENRLVVQRARTLSKLPDSWFDEDSPRYKLRSGAIGYDTLQNDIAEIWQTKCKYRDKLLTDTGCRDSHNKPIKLMPPTIVFLDSISDVIAKEYDLCDKKSIDGIDELRSNMAGAQYAKTLRNFLGDILPMMKEANIMFLVISHKSSVISGPFGVKKQFQYGAHDEKIAGGKALEYNASGVINLSAETSEDSRYHTQIDGFEGNTVLFEPTKSSTSESGNIRSGLGFQIVIDKRENGADNIRSLILFLNNKGRLKGNKTGFRVIDDKGEPISEKFSWKNVYQDFNENPATMKIFMKTAKEELLKIVSKAPDNAGKINPFDIDDYISE